MEWPSCYHELTSIKKKAICKERQSRKFAGVCDTGTILVSTTALHCFPRDFLISQENKPQRGEVERVGALGHVAKHKSNSYTDTVLSI